ncbi:MAG: hypothetical protein R6U44_08970 [Archaeoglobaceae archaeon]
MKIKVAIALLAVALILSFIAPSEAFLGDYYKLIYFHLPLSIISFASLFLFPAAVYFSWRPQNMVVATIAFLSVNLGLSAIFMQVAWGGISTAEPRAVFSIFLLLLLVLFLVCLMLSRSVALVYSVVQLILAIWLYQGVSEAPFQLHPISLVDMGLLMKLPLVFTFPALVLIYYRLTEINTDSLKSISIK